MASNKRERELARMRAERQAARRAAQEAQRRARRNTLLIGLSAAAVVAVVVVAAVVIGTGSSKKKTTDTLSNAGAGAGNVGGTATCSYSKSGTASKTVKGLPPTAKVANTGANTATLTTSKGTVQLSLLTAKAPCTVNSFMFLAQEKYFDGTPCHRLTTAGIFVLQCGDPSGTGSGGPGYSFADENLSKATYPKGTIAMANSGPGTNGSQFFIVYKDTQLDAKYTPWGTVTSGLDVIQKIADAGSDNSNSAGDGKPKTPISLTGVTVS